MIALCDGHQRKVLTTVKVGCKKTFPGRPSAIKFTKFCPESFFQTFRQICILALLICAVTAFQLQYWIRFGTWLWLGESKLMLMKLLGGFPILDLAGQRCFHIEAWQTFRSGSEFDSKLKALVGWVSGLECMDFFWASRLQQNRFLFAFCCCCCF